MGVLVKRLVPAGSVLTWETNRHTSLGCGILWSRPLVETENLFYHSIGFFGVSPQLARSLENIQQAERAGSMRGAVGMAWLIASRAFFTSIDSPEQVVTRARQTTLRRAVLHGIALREAWSRGERVMSG